MILGHNDERVTSAVRRAAESGISPTLHAEAQLDLADRLHDWIPGAEMSLFCKSGSDATSAAVRLARGATGKKHVLKWGYHGWHDWSAPRDYGIPSKSQNLVHELTYNDEQDLARLCSAYDGDIAAIIGMPLETELPSDTWLHALRASADGQGAVFILDEIRTGFRLARGGAQEHFGVRADLVTVSKAMANGHPISAVTGSTELLRHVGDMSVSSVFFRSRDGFAAALATMDALESDSAISRLWMLGERLQRGLSTSMARHGLTGARATGLPPMPFHSFGLEPDREAEAQVIFSGNALRYGALFHPTHHWFVSAAMEVADIDQAIEAADSGYAAVASWRGERAA